MAAITTTPMSDAAAGPPDPPGLRCVQLGERDRRWALSLLLTGRTEGGDMAVEHFLSYVSEQGLSLDNLWVATKGEDAPVARAAALIVPNAGRTAMAFVSPVFDSRDEPWAAALLRHMCRGLDPAAVRMVQSLLDPPQRREQQVFAAAGFHRLADLLYMHRSTDLPPMPLTLPPGLEAVHYSEATRPLFAQAILDSYRDTLDCPGLLGLRPIEDVLAGHMATGTFAPTLWWAVHRQGEPAAVMLLNLLPQRATAELVYLGLSPTFRGMGLARLLLLHGLSMIPQHGATAMVLAVDHDNAPAIRLYRRLAFVSGTKKTAMIHVLPQHGAASA
jgi:mycothiol synthase